MFLIIGLGNPGSRYECTRHNVGFMVLDRLGRELGVAFRKAPYHSLATRVGVSGNDLVLIKPQTYMNNSGIAVAGATRWHKVSPESLIIVYDDMDLEVGRLRIRARGSAGGHNGMKSVVEHLGTEEIVRLRLGIGRPEPWDDPVDYVTGLFRRDELPAMSDAIMCAVRAILCIVEEGVDVAQTRFN
ncbi:MAG TPA: aminoacyl-tRNA hydrolase [Bacillota bacterium]|nr:aminoacyl-tRNA hydrolase [Bacillota bacterium]